MAKISSKPQMQITSTKEKALESLKQSRIDQIEGKQSKKIDLAGNFEDMISLTLASIKYQDPLNPRDASEFGRDAMSLAEAQALVDIRETLIKQNSMNIDNQLLQASAQVGRTVEMEGNRFHYNRENKQDLAYFLPQGVYKAIIQITDEKGKVLHSHTVRAKGKQALESKRYTYTFDGKPTTPAGEHVAKDGRLPEGLYSIKILAYDSKNKQLLDPETAQRAKIPTSVTGRITGGAKSPDGALLKMGEVSYPMGHLIAIQEPENSKENSEQSIERLAQILKSKLQE